MIGAILGAMQGVQAIPAEEIAALEGENRQDFEANGNRFIETAAWIQANWFTAKLLDPQVTGAFKNEKRLGGNDPLLNRFFYTLLYLDKAASSTSYTIFWIN